MSAQPVALLLPGASPPPDRIEPSRYVAMSCWLLRAAFDACVICPTLSSRLIRDNRSATRVATGCDASWYGSPVAAFAVWVSTTVPTTASARLPIAATVATVRLDRATIACSLPGEGPGRRTHCRDGRHDGGDGQHIEINI